MIKTIEQAVKAHDKYQVEIKLDYQLLPGTKTHYRISTYFFIPQSHRLGILKEKVSFVREEDIPSAVLIARNRDHITELDNDGQGENIICYSKDIILFADAFKQVFIDMPEITGINDIMRYDIRAYLNKMGVPVHERAYLDDGQLIPVLCHKVYHLNIVSQYTAVASQKEKLYKRSRLVLNQKGIKRVEIDVPVKS